MRYFVFLLLFFVSFFIACSSEKNEEVPFDTEKALEMLKKEIENGTYFHEKRRVIALMDMIVQKDSTYFDKDIWPDSIEIDIHKTILLRVLNADDFTKFKTTDSVEAYRIEIDRSRNPEKIWLTAENRNSIKRLIIQSFYTDRECAPYFGSKSFQDSCVYILKNRVIILSDKNWDKIQLMIEEAEFWDLQGDLNTTGIDGSYWTLEGSKMGFGRSGYVQKYWEIIRYNPQPYQGIYQIGMELLRLSGEDWGEIY